MNHDCWIILLGDIIAAGRVERLPARTPWPMHSSLLGLYEEAGRVGLRARAGLDMAFVPSPEVGRRALGADAALRALVQEGLLSEVGLGLDARLDVNAAAAIRSRRRLLGMDPEVVALLQRAGARWAALASTCAKYSDSAPASPLGIVASATA
jgi:hypothetical protein